MTARLNIGDVSVQACLHFSLHFNTVIRLQKAPTTKILSLFFNFYYIGRWCLVGTQTGFLGIVSVVF